jgi:hypothetical protein
VGWYRTHLDGAELAAVQRVTHVDDLRRSPRSIAALIRRGYGQVAVRSMQVIEINNAFTYFLIEAAQRSEIDLLLPCAMSNHYLCAAAHNQ